jgi:hypothetical protein
MRGHVGTPIPGEADGVLGVRSHGEHRTRDVNREMNSCRDESARPSDRSRLAKRVVHNAVVAPRHDRAVVGQEPIGDQPEAITSVGIVYDNRFVGPVSTRHHEGTIERRQ